MVLRDFAEVLNIVCKYVDPTTEWLESSHAVIWLPLPGDTDLSNVDADRLRELGAYVGDSDVWEVST